MRRLGVGVVGCGNISMTYLRNAALFPGVELRACADLSADMAQLRAAEYGIRARAGRGAAGGRGHRPRPQSHHAQRTLRHQLGGAFAGKHVFTEKPLATSSRRAGALVAEARRRRSGAGLGTRHVSGRRRTAARRLMDEGAIGRPVAGTAFMMGRGMEHWHPNPQFYYQPGGGPVLDMGPYYLTMLVNLLGPVRQVMAMASIGSAERVITAPGPDSGTSFPSARPPPSWRCSSSWAAPP